MLYNVVQFSQELLAANNTINQSHKFGKTIPSTNSEHLFVILTWKLFLLQPEHFIVEHTVIGFGFGITTVNRLDNEQKTTKNDQR